MTTTATRPTYYDTYITEDDGVLMEVTCEYDAETGEFLGEFIQEYNLQTGLKEIGSTPWLPGGALASYEPPPELIEGVCFERSLISLYGQANTGKTFVALNIALSLANDLKWGNRYVAPGWVAYLLAEGQGGVSKRLEAWQKEFQGNLNDVEFYPQALDLTNSIETHALIRQLKHLQERHSEPLRLLIIDPLIECLGGADDSDAEAMSSFVTNIKRIRDELECAIMVVTHTGHSEKRRERGSSIWRGAVDTSIACSADAAGKEMLLTCQKQRDHEKFLPISFYAKRVETDKGQSIVLVEQPVEGAFSDDLNEAEATGELNRRAMLRILGEHPMGISAKDWLAELRISRSTGYRHIKRLLKENKIERVDQVYKLVS